LTERGGRIFSYKLFHEKKKKRGIRGPQQEKTIREKKVLNASGLSPILLKTRKKVMWEKNVIEGGKKTTRNAS